MAWGSIPRIFKPEMIAVVKVEEEPAVDAERFDCGLNLLQFHDCSGFFTSYEKNVDDSKDSAQDVSPIETHKKTDPLWGSQQVGTDSPRILGVGWDPRRNSFKFELNIVARFC